MEIRQATPEDLDPQFVTLLLYGLLLRLGGQQTFTFEELNEANQVYYGVRFANNFDTREVTLTLRTREAGVDPG